MSDGTDVVTMDMLDDETRASVESKVTFKDDGSMLFNSAGNELTGTWAPTGASTVILYFDATEEFPEIPNYTGTLDDGTLAIEEQGIVMLLEKTA